MLRGAVAASMNIGPMSRTEDLPRVHQETALHNRHKGQGPIQDKSPKRHATAEPRPMLVDTSHSRDREKTVPYKLLIEDDHALVRHGEPVLAQATVPLSPVLTARQLAILKMLDQGLTNKHIALQLGLAEKTIKNHVTALFGALHVANRLQAIRQARHVGLLP